MLKKYHPDHFSGNKKYAEEKTAKINEAYEKLKPIFEAKEEEKELKKFMSNLGEKQKINPNKKVVKNVAKTKDQPKEKSTKKRENKVEKKPKKQEVKKEKVIENTLIKDERKEENDIGKKILDVSIVVLGAIAILLLILFLTGVIRWQKNLKKWKG